MMPTFLNTVAAIKASVLLCSEATIARQVLLHTEKDMAEVHACQRSKS